MNSQPFSSLTKLLSIFRCAIYVTRLLLFSLSLSRKVLLSSVLFSSPHFPSRHRLSTSPSSPHWRLHLPPLICMRHLRRHHFDGAILAITTSTASFSPSPLRHRQLRHRHFCTTIFASRFGIVNFATNPFIDLAPQPSSTSPSGINGRFFGFVRLRLRIRGELEVR